jgi:hypothetical protein
MIGEKDGVAVIMRLMGRFRLEVVDKGEEDTNE